MKVLMRVSTIALFLISAATVSGRSRQALSTPPLFSDNMVIQRNTTPRIWGKAAPGKTVVITTSWDMKTYNAVAGADSCWNVVVESGDAGGPYSVSIKSGKEKKEFTNVMLGDVWLCSGQSNMEMPVQGWGLVDGNAEAVANSVNYDKLRIMQVARDYNSHPQTDFSTSIGDGWQKALPETVHNFSAVAYFYGTELVDSLDVPIGVIDATWGGTIIEAWTSEKSLAQLPGRSAELESVKNNDISRATDSKANPNRFTLLYNSMINPLTPFSVKGAIWYQGESNAGAPYLYRDLMPLMIRDWREKWGIDFPFYMVQISSFRMSKDLTDTGWAALREAQARTLSLENTGMVVTTDIGNPDDIHPKNKKEVGHRLALQALAKTYGRNIPCSGPVFHHFKVVGNRAIVSFRNVYDGLKTSDGLAPAEFEIAGIDCVYHKAQAEIQGDKIVLYSPEVALPNYIRYAWSDCPSSCNLYNSVGLPAEPFRTDDWR